MILSELIYRHIFRGSIVRKMCGATIRISDKAIIRNSRIVASPGTNIIIKDKCIVDNVEMYLNKGSVIIGDNSILSGRKNEKLKIIVNNGMMEMADHSKLSCRRIWLRFGGCLSIGRYTNINEGSEIRCDECVEIGSYIRFRIMCVFGIQIPIPYLMPQNGAELQKTGSHISDTNPNAPPQHLLRLEMTAGLEKTRPFLKALNLVTALLSASAHS